MGVLEDLYHGAFYPAEKILPKTERYTASKTDAIALAEELKKQLTAEQFDLFESYCNAKAHMADEMYCECFRQGIIFGVKLMMEIDES